MRQIQMRRLLLSIIIIAAVCAVCSTAWGQYAPQVSGKQINLDVKDTPLPLVLEMIFKDSGFSYTVDPGINNLKVTLVFKDIPFDTALKNILKAAGATYRMENGVYNIAPRSDVSSINNSPAPYSRPSRVSSNTGELKIEKIPLAFIEPSDIIRILQSEDNIQIVKTGTNYIIIHGSEPDIKATKELIHLIDTPDAFPRAVRVKLTIKATVTEQGQKPKSYEATTESVGVVGSMMPLHIKAGRGSEQNVYAPPPPSTGMEIQVNLTPALASEAVGGSEKAFDGKTITLSGQGRIGGSLPFNFDKMFDVAISATPGEAVIIAAGSADLSEGKIEFYASAVATVEKGRVQAKPSTPVGGYPGQPGSIPHGGYSYGGYSPQRGF